MSNPSDVVVDPTGGVAADQAGQAGVNLSDGIVVGSTDGVVAVIPGAAAAGDRNAMDAAITSESAGERPAPSDFRRFVRWRARDRFVSGLWQEVRSLSPSVLFPVQKWLADQPWTLVWVRWFAFFALGPLLLVHYLADHASVADVARAFAAYFAGLGGFMLYRCLGLPPIRLASILLVAGFTATVGSLMVLVAQDLPVIERLYAAASSENFARRAAGQVLGVGLVEESAKALPVIWYVLRRKASVRPGEAGLLGIVSGLTFGLVEVTGYSMDYLLAHGLGGLGAGEYLLVQLLRLTSLPLLHGCLTGIVGYFIEFAAGVPRQRRALVLVGLGVAALLHGLYNTFAGSVVGLGVATLTFLGLVAYGRCAERILGDLRAAADGACTR